jgi:kojibiose phosphorylase
VVVAKTYAASVAAVFPHDLLCTQCYMVLNVEVLPAWNNVLSRIRISIRPDGTIEQFEGDFQRRDIELASLKPRKILAQVLFGIEPCNETQILRRPDVLMLQYLLRDEFTDEQLLELPYNL